MTRNLLAALLLALIAGINAGAKSKAEKAYLFGMAASFNDSTVYFTEIQPLDTVWLAEKTHFLMGRNEYAAQLREHLAAQGENNRTCIVCFDTNLKRLTGKYAKLKAKYTDAFKKKKKMLDRKAFIVKDLTPADFTFKTVKPYEAEETAPVKKKARKKSRKAMPGGGQEQGQAPGEMQPEEPSPR